MVITASLEAAKYHLGIAACQTGASIDHIGYNSIVASRDYQLVG
jgi:hypothetical protein